MWSQKELIDEPEGPVRGWGVFAHGFTLDE